MKWKYYHQKQLHRHAKDYMNTINSYLYLIIMLFLTLKQNKCIRIIRNSHVQCCWQLSSVVDHEHCNNWPGQQHQTQEPVVSDVITLDTDTTLCCALIQSFPGTALLSGPSRVMMSHDTKCVLKPWCLVVAYSDDVTSNSISSHIQE